MGDSGEKRQSTEIPLDIIEKMSTVLILGNTGELDELLIMLRTETNPQLLQYIITILGAAGDQKAVEPLTIFLGTSHDRNLRRSAKAAIEMIQSHNY